MFEKTTSDDHCPFLDRACIKDKCHMWIKIYKTDATKPDETSEHPACGIAHVPHLFIELISVMRHNTAYAQQGADIQARNAEMNEQIGTVLMRRIKERQS